MPLLSLREFEAEARRRLDPEVYDFFAGGAEDEITLRANEAAFRRIGLVPRVLRGKCERNLDITLLGCHASMPIVIAPTAFHRLAHPDGESATARAATAAGTIVILSMASTTPVEEVAAAAGDGSNLWFQIYIQPDLAFTESIVGRAEAAGCKALMVSVDSPAFGRRERDLRNGFCELPDGMCCENLRDRRNGGGPRRIQFAAELSWQHIEWLRSVTRLPIALKGVMHPEDARIAVDLGIEALLVSNHGGRQLDTVPASIELLPPIVDAVGGCVPLLLDGGIRRGTDVVKAFALGVNAVAIGRPVLWGLAVAGEDGVAQVLEMLRAEFEHALTLCGCGSPSDLARDLLLVSRTEERC
jgi:4-hydroxymandelate oxidase